MSDAASDKPTGATATTAAPSPPAADAPTRTSARVDDSAPAPVRVHDDRLPAPLQYRDPDRYLIIGEHGRGGLGRVLRARDKELGRDVAVKELLQRGTTSELRFFREALITARLEHPGIVPVHEAGRWPDGTPFYAMKLVQGRPLRELIDECKTLQDRLALLPHVVAVADAIAYAHDRKIIHRDLKPSNVIVGAFGETVVIDWGLAKDLTSEIPDAIDDGPYRSPPPDGLTQAGSVLGTPAYMAPEQAEGRADERSDIYAIGAMVYSIVCGTVPHPGQALRLPRKRISRDLAAIVEKASHPDPERRYASAKLLADDLRRLGDRRPVRARRYSLISRAVLGFARHRATSLVLLAALFVIISTLVVETYRIARQRAATEDSLDQLTLKHAELLLTSDPSAALDTLATYGGSDRDTARRLEAQARGTGVAIVRAVPHSDNIVWVGGVPGAVATLSTDGTIVRTGFDGATHVLATGVSPSGIASYSTKRGMLAYACDPSNVCLLDLQDGQHTTLPTSVTGDQPTSVVLSPDGSRLATLSRAGTLTVVDVSQPVAHVIQSRPKVDPQTDIRFFDDDRVAIVSSSGVDVLSMDASTHVDAAGTITSSSQPRRSMLALGTLQGDGLVVDGWSGQVRSHLALCKGAVVGLDFAGDERSVAYECEGGVVGTWDVGARTNTTLARFDEVGILVASPDGDYVLVGEGEGSLAIVDLRTGLVSSYKGHGYRLTAIVGPSPGWPYFASADVRGAVRVWGRPSRHAHVVDRSASSLVRVAFLGGDDLVATTWGPALTAYSARSGGGLLEPHERDNIFITASESRDRFATYGFGDHVEVWSRDTRQREQLLATGHGAVSQVQFYGSDGTLVTGGQDGRLILWAHGTPEVLTTVNQAISMVEVVARTNEVVFAAADGELWRLDGKRHVSLLYGGHGQVMRLQLSADGSTLVAGFSDGVVVVFGTHDWGPHIVLRAGDAVRDIAITRDARMIAVATNGEDVHVGNSVDGNWNSAQWMSFPARARSLAITIDGIVTAACADGALVLFSSALHEWLYVPTGRTPLTSAAMSPDERTVATVDASGRIIWIGMDDVRNGFAHR